MRRVSTRVLPRARAGADQQGLSAVLHGFGLLGVQIADEIVGGHAR